MPHGSGITAKALNCVPPDHEVLLLQYSDVLGSTVVLLLEPGVSVARGTGPILYGESLLVSS